MGRKMNIEFTEDEIKLAIRFLAERKSISVDWQHSTVLLLRRDGKEAKGIKAVIDGELPETALSRAIVAAHKGG